MNISTKRGYIEGMSVRVREVEAKSILRKHKKIDSWFISCYGMNLYRGCSHNCSYCDGRAESYNVDGVFGEEVSVKVNAIDLLRRELDPRRKRVPLKRCYIMPGGGVGDSYNPLEEKYRLTRGALELICEYGFPVHMLTKSTLIKRDVDVLREINEKSRAIISFSFSSVSDEVSAIFEPGVPPPSKRLETIEFFKEEGFSCGMFLLPVIPFVTDTPEMMEESIRLASEIGVDFIIFGDMTLKEGRQMDHFLRVLVKNYPKLTVEYDNIYRGNKWGGATEEYRKSVNETFSTISKKYKIPKRIPPALYTDILSENDRVIVMLEQIDYLLKLEGKNSPYGYAAYSISQLKEPLSSMLVSLTEIKGVGKTTERIIQEILDKKTSSYLEKLLK